MSNYDHTTFERELEQQASQFSMRPGGAHENAVKTYIVADFEFSHDRSRFECYQMQEGRSAERNLRWPFCRIAAVSWVVMRFRPGVDMPDIDTPVISSATNDEPESARVAAFFDALIAEPTAILTTWGGEVRDLAVLRQCAAESGLILPPQIADLSPLSHHRIDLCDAVSVRSESVHLSEYSTACSIPAKPTPSKAVGKLVETEQWALVEEQCLADVLSTAVIFARHLASRAQVTVPPVNVVKALGERAVAALPGSKFIRHTFAPWARALHARAQLKGEVFCAAPVQPRSPQQTLKDPVM